jgi:hypothetical protein
VQLKLAIKDEAHEIISATLALYYSAVNDETPSEMILTARDSSQMEELLGKLLTGMRSPGKTMARRELPIRGGKPRSLQTKRATDIDWWPEMD